MAAIELRMAKTDPDRAAVFALRHGVFVVEQSVPESIEQDEYDDVALHILALADGRPVGTGRLVEKPGRVGKIGRMAVLEEARRLGIGRRVLEKLLEHATERGLAEVFLDAQVHALGFYARAGFKPEGARFIEAGIEHQRMRRTLP